MRRFYWRVAILVVGLLLYQPLMLNLGRLYLNRVFWSGPLPEQRLRTQIQIAVGLLRLGGVAGLADQDEPICGSTTNMLLAQEAYQDGLYETAVFYLDHILSTHEPIAYVPVQIPSWVELTETGDMILTWESYAWAYRRDTAVAPPIQYVGTHLQMTVPPTLAPNQKIIYQMKESISLQYWQTLSIKTALPKSVRFIVETRSQQGELQRHINFQDEMGQNQTFEIDLLENDLFFIYLAILLDNSVSTEASSVVGIQPIILKHTTCTD